LFDEYIRVGSGHPQWKTFGWVKNDDTNLYVAIDFTPDNTMDGDMDYAAVYIKTENGLEEFKVSSIMQDWGVAGFTYTDRAAYQNKVYEFAIPYEKIGIDTKPQPTNGWTGLQGRNEPLEIAFAAYGTASPSGNYFPDIAFNRCTGTETGSRRIVRRARDYGWFRRLQ